MKIARNRLRVTDPAALANFYAQALGMRNFGDSALPLLGYDESQALLELSGGATRSYAPLRSDFYWKIGITLRDLDHTVAYLREIGWPVSEPVQFRDIGYLCHLRDPQGFIVELLQQGFEGHSSPAGEGHPVGGQATLAHITLRINHLQAALDHCTGPLGLHLMSVQPVAEHGFCLYFLSAIDEPLPVDDLEAVENREWLWRRPYTLLELQHFPGGGVAPPVLDEESAGFVGLALQRAAGGNLEQTSPDDWRDWV